MDAGWRQDPDRSDRLRWHDGEEWTHDTVRPETLRARAAPLRRWAIVTSVCLSLVVVAVALAVRIDLRGIALLESFTGFDSDFRNRMDTFDSLARTSTARVWIPVAAAAVSWLVWPYQLARLLPASSLRWSPEAQVAWWLVPVAHLVLPALCLAACRRGLGGRGPSLLLVLWWVQWVVLLVTLPAVFQVWLEVDSVPAMRDYLVLSVWFQGLLAAGSLVAVAMVWRLTGLATDYLARVPDLARPVSGSPR